MRMLIAVAAAIAATSVSFAVATAANQAPAAQRSAATDRAIVQELKELNRAIGSSKYTGLRGELRTSLGTPSYPGDEPILPQLKDICVNVAQYASDC